MWKPPERIRHQTHPGAWPSAAEARAAKLFSPFREGRLRHADRTWVPAMVPWRASEAGEVTEDVVDWYARFAAGRPGAIVVEATGIRDMPSGPLLRIGHGRFVPGLKRLVEAVPRVTTPTSTPSSRTSSPPASCGACGPSSSGSCSGFPWRASGRASPS